MRPLWAGDTQTCCEFTCNYSILRWSTEYRITLEYIYVVRCWKHEKSCSQDCQVWDKLKIQRYRDEDLLMLYLTLSRGSYPAVSSRYSRELRDLIDSCLRSQPRQRPSINGILRLPFIQKRIENFLSESVSYNHDCTCIGRMVWIMIPIPPFQPPS